MHTRSAMAGLAFVAVTAIAVPPCSSQTIPSTVGESLNGNRIVLADAARGHATILVAGFSREGGAGCGDWVKAIRSDPALSRFSVFQIAMLEGAPGIFRGPIKSAMRKGLSSGERDQFIVLTQDNKLWQEYFDVSAMKDPYVTLIDAKGNILWHGHGAAANLEPLLKAALQ